MHMEGIISIIIITIIIINVAGMVPATIISMLLNATLRFHTDHTSTRHPAARAVNIQNQKITPIPPGLSPQSLFEISRVASSRLEGCARIGLARL